MSHIFQFIIFRKRICEDLADCHGYRYIENVECRSYYAGLATLSLEIAAASSNIYNIVIPTSNKNILNICSHVLKQTDNRYHGE